MALSFLLPRAGQAATCQLAGLVDCLVVPSEGLGMRGGGYIAAWFNLTTLTLTLSRLREREM